MKDWPALPDDADLERADALLDQADALLRRHRGAPLRPPSPPPPPVSPVATETRLEPLALEDDDDLPILTDIVEDFELADLDVPLIDDLAPAPAAFEPPADAMASTIESGAYPATAPEDEFPPDDGADRRTDGAPAEADVPGSAQAAAAGMAAAMADITPAPGVPELPARAREIPQTTPAAEHALLVSARAALIEELIELDTEIARAVEAWLAEELPPIVARELDSLAERIRTEALAQLRATLLPALSERIAHRIDKLVD